MTINDFAMGYFGLEGKNAIVTGGNSGLGQAFTLALAKAGANVFVPSIADDDGSLARWSRPRTSATSSRKPTSRRRAPRSRSSTNAWSASGPSTSSSTVRVCARWPRCSSSARAVGRDSAGQPDRRVRDELRGREADGAAAQREDHQHLLDVQLPRRAMSPAYSATKHGIAGLTKAYCDELAQHNIQVNGIAPGYYATAITASTRSNPEASRRVLDHIPAGPLG